MKYVFLFLSSICFGDGIKKAVTNQAWSTANHWDISKVFIDYKKNKIIMDVELYVNKQAKTNGDAAVKKGRYNFEISQKLLNKKDLLDLLKTNPEFSEAIDD